MGYGIWGKRTKAWYDSEEKKWNEPDKVFRALDANGQRVNRLVDAFEFATQEDCEDFISNHTWREGVELDIRKLK